MSFLTVIHDLFVALFDYFANLLTGDVTTALAGLLGISSS
jgi:hypothetical protein